MGRFYAATITPSKGELLAAWVPTQPWGPSPGSPLEVVGAYRFDDPEGEVGMEVHLVRGEGVLFQVPLTYRNDEVPGAGDALVGTMEHSDLGTRWVYDGLRDPLCVLMLAALAMTGQGEALGMALYDGRWYIAPATVRVHGGGWGTERVPVDGFEPVSSEPTDPSVAVLRNDRFELTVFRRPVVGDQPPIGLTATWADQPDPVVLATVTELV